jgi:spore germination protein
MTIHVVKQGDTITSIASQYGLSAERIIIENELPNPDNLVVGQSILILYPNVTHTVVAGDTVESIATAYKVTQAIILQNNPFIAESDGLISGVTLVISYKDKENLGTIITNGYAYPFINRTVLRKTLPFLTYLSIFTYGFTPEGALVPIDDEELIQLALSYNVAPIMMLAPMDANQTFSNEIAHNLFANPEGQQTLINNILANIQAKGYKGIDIDFEFVLPEDREAFVKFISDVKAKLSPEGYIVMAALAPKTSGEQSGLLYTAHDYPAIGAIADLVLLMTYEWGYTLAHI